MFNLFQVDNQGKLSESKAKETAKKIFEDGDQMLANLEELFSRCIHGTFFSKLYTQTMKLRNDVRSFCHVCCKV